MNEKIYLEQIEILKDLAIKFNFDYLESRYNELDNGEIQIKHLLYYKDIEVKDYYTREIYLKNDYYVIIQFRLNEYNDLSINIKVFPKNFTIGEFAYGFTHFHQLTFNTYDLLFEDDIYILYYYSDMCLGTSHSAVIINQLSNKYNNHTFKLLVVSLGKVLGIYYRNSPHVKLGDWKNNKYEIQTGLTYKGKRANFTEEEKKEIIKYYNKIKFNLDERKFEYLIVDKEMDLPYAEYDLDKLNESLLDIINDKATEYVIQLDDFLLNINIDKNEPIKNNKYLFHMKITNANATLNYLIEKKSIIL